MEKSMIVDALEKCEFFDGLNRADIQRIAGICRFKSYAAGETIFEQGDSGENLYVILDGLVFLERSLDLGSRKGRITIESLGKGRVLGCWSTLLNETHVMMSTATCREATGILVLKGSELRGIMTENVAFGFNIMEKFCHILLERIQAAYGAMEKI